MPDTAHVREQVSRHWCLLERNRASPPCTVAVCKRLGFPLYASFILTTTAASSRSSGRSPSSSSSSSSSPPESLRLRASSGSTWGPRGINPNHGAKEHRHARVPHCRQQAAGPAWPQPELLSNHRSGHTRAWRSGKGMASSWGLRKRGSDAEGREECRGSRGPPYTHTGIQLPPKSWRPCPRRCNVTRMCC